MGTNDDSVRVVYDADGKPVGEWRLVAVPISPEERRAMLDGPSVGSVGSPGGGESRFAGTCGTDAPGSSCSFLSSGVKFLDDAGMRELNEEYQRLCEQEMSVFVKAGKELLSRWLSELKAENAGSGLTVGVDQGLGPSVGLPKGVKVVREGVTASEVRSMTVSTRPPVLRSGRRRPEFAWIDNYEVVCVPCPTLEEAFGPDDPGFWWVRGTDWVRSDAVREDWARRCRLESQGSAEDQAALMRRVDSMLLESGASWEGSESDAGATWCHRFGDETPTLTALERSLAGIGGHFPALWCWEVPLLGGWRSSWTLADWRAGGDGSVGPVESIATLVVPEFVWCPSVHPCPRPSIGAQLVALGGPWLVLECLLEPVLNLTAWDHGVSAWCRGFNPGPSEWWCPESAQIPMGWREADCMFRVWLSECGECPLNGGGA